MTWLFIRLYIGVLAVLFMAWYIHGVVWQQRSNADLARVILEAHGGGARLVAKKINAGASGSRDEVLKNLRRQFAYGIHVQLLEEAPESVQHQFSHGQDVAHHRDGHRNFVVGSLAGGSELVWLGPLPNYQLRQIEDSMRGWMRLAAKELDTPSVAGREAKLNQLRRRFDIPVEIIDLQDLPEAAGIRIASGEGIVFFEQDPAGSDRYLSVTPLIDQSGALQFGPFPSFERIDQNAAATTLALVLLPAALAIAFLIRPVVRQLRHVENAARAIASGNLEARVDEDRVRAARPMAHAFNRMASQTESLLRSQQELLQAVSHELRTPLARLRFATELIETASTDEERRERLRNVDDATQQLDDLVSELLTYVRAESSADEMKPELVCVRDLLAEAIETSEPLYPSTHFEISHDCCEIRFVTDRNGLQRAINNLARNAARFANSAVVLSAVSAESSVCIRVDDDGPGVAEQDRERIFQPFVRIGDRRDGGCGLGLALVHRIVTAQGGTIQVEKSPSGGARFEITLQEHSVHPPQPRPLAKGIST